MLRLAFDFIITWRETRTRPNAYFSVKTRKNHQKFFVVFRKCHILGAEIEGQR